MVSIFGFETKYLKEINQILISNDIQEYNTTLHCKVAICFLPFAYKIALKLKKKKVTLILIALETCLVNIKFLPYHLLIAPDDPIYKHNSVFLNPFPFKQYGREKSLNLYREMLESSPSLLNDLFLLTNKILGCKCYPKVCHGNILIEKLKQLENAEIQKLVKHEHETDEEVEYQYFGKESIVKQEIEELSELYSLNCYQLREIEKQHNGDYMYVVFLRKKLYRTVFSSNH